MAYEVFKRTAVRVEAPTLSIFPDGRIALNTAATRAVVEAGVKFVVLLWDKSNNKLALKAVPKGDANAYKVSIPRTRNAGTLRAKLFFTHIRWSALRREMLAANWNDSDKMLEVTLPRKYVGTEVDRDHKRETKSGL